MLHHLVYVKQNENDDDDDVDDDYNKLKKKLINDSVCCDFLHL